MFIIKSYKWLLGGIFIFSMHSLISMKRGEADFLSAEPLNAEVSKKQKVDSHVLTIRLLDAVQKNDGHEIKELIRQGADINAEDADGCTPLMIAVQKEYCDLVKQFIEWGADINAQDDESNTALFYAVEVGNKELVRILIDAGIDVKWTNCDDVSALELAAQKANESVMEELLQAEHGNRRKAEALAAAAYSGNPAAVEKLLKAGAQVNMPLQGNLTPCMYAVAGRHKELLKKILEAGAVPTSHDEHNISPLLYAVWNKQEEAAQLLIKHGASSEPEKFDEAQEFDKELIRALIKKDIKQALFVLELGAKVLPLFRKIENEKDDNLLQTLIEVVGGDVNTVNSYGYTCLMMAAEAGFLYITQALLKKGAQVDIKTETEVTALTLAAANGHKEIVQELLAHGALPVSNDAVTDDSNAFLLAVIRDDLPTASSFIALRGRDIARVCGDGGMTSLMWAACMNSTHVLKSLLDAKVSFVKKDALGNTALSFAVAAGNTAIVKEFLENQFKKVDSESRFNDFIQRVFSFVKQYVSAFWSLAVSPQELVESMCATLKASSYTGTNDFIITVDKLLEEKSANFKGNLRSMVIFFRDFVNGQNNEGETPLMLAIGRNRKEIFNMLLEAGARCDVANKDGDTPVSLAIGEGNWAMMVKLVEKGGIGKLNVEEVSKKRTEEYLPFFLSSFSQPEIDQYLRNYKKYLAFSNEEIKAHLLGRTCFKDNHSRCFHQTVLMWAALFGHEEMVDKLLGCSLPVWYLNVHDAYGWTAVRYALLVGNRSIALKLINAHEQASSSLKNKRVINIADDRGDTALIRAIEQGDLLLVKRLIKVGAWPTIRAIKVAVELGYSEMATRLLSLIALKPNGQRWPNLM